MSRPISLRALKHTCTLEPYSGMVAGAPTYGASVTLSRVRLEPVKHNALTGLGEMKDDKFILFFDTRNSLPSGQTFAKKARVTFDSIALTIREIVPCYGDSASVHHYEVHCV